MKIIQSTTTADLTVQQLITQVYKEDELINPYKELSEYLNSNTKEIIKPIRSKKMKKHFILIVAIMTVALMSCENGNNPSPSYLIEITSSADCPVKWVSINDGIDRIKPGELKNFTGKQGKNIVEIEGEGVHEFELSSKSDSWEYKIICE